MSKKRFGFDEKRWLTDNRDGFAQATTKVSAQTITNRLNALDEQVKQETRKYNTLLDERRNLQMENDQLVAALRWYADEDNYFPRWIVLECHEKGVKLAPVYSEFGEMAREALARYKEVDHE